MIHCFNLTCFPFLNIAAVLVLSLHIVMSSLPKETQYIFLGKLCRVLGSVCVCEHILLKTYKCYAIKHQQELFWSKIPPLSLWS